MTNSPADGPHRVTPDPLAQNASGLVGAPIQVDMLSPIQGQFSIQAVQAVHMGPLPPAHELEAYERAHAGTAPWILKEAGTSAEHTRAMERRAMDIAARDAFHRRLFPLIVMCLLILTFGCIACFKNVYVGSLGAGATLIALGVAYFQGAAGQRIDRASGSEAKSVDG